MLHKNIYNPKSNTLLIARRQSLLVLALVLLAGIMQAQNTLYIVKGGPDTGHFSGGVFIGLTSKVNYNSNESTVLLDSKLGIVEGSWKDVTGITQSTTSLSKTASDGWGNAGATSNSILDTLQNGWLQYKVNNLSDILAFGFSSNNVDGHYNSINYSVMINAGQLYVYNQGQLVGNYGAVAMNDSIRISRIGNILFFTKNKQEFYNKEVDAKQPLMADVSIYTQGAIVQLKSSFAKPCDANFNVIVTPVSQTILSGESATLTANGATYYNWSTGETTNSVTVSPISTTSYTVTGITNGCSDTAVATITVNPDTTEGEEEPDIDAMMSEPGANFYDIQARMLTYFSEHPEDTIETDGLRSKYNRWEWFWQDRLDDALTHSKSGGFNAAYKQLASFVQNPVCNTPSTITSNWTGLGPFSQPNPTANQNMGIIPALYVDPFNNNNIFAGSNTSGLFKTANGGGNWINPDVSRLPAMGIKSIVVDPASNNQTIYIATNMAAMGRPGYGLGVLKSTDGGAHWNQTALTMTPTSSEFGDFNVYKILRDPNNTTNSTNIYYAITDHKVYKTTDGFNSSLLDKTPPGADHFRDIQFRASFSNILFAVGDNKLYQTLSAGNSWTNVTSNLSSPVNISRMAISVIADAVYVFYRSNNQSKIDKYTFSTNTWSNVSTPNLGDYNSVFVVSPVDPLVMYLGQGQNVLQKSTNGGISFFPITNYNSTFNGTYTHSDIRNIQLLQGSIGGSADKLYVGNDGGILKSINGGTSWTNINGSGLNVTQFYGIGGTEQNPNLIVGGTQDNGFYTYNAPNWSVQLVGDAYDACIDKMNPNVIFGSSNSYFNYLKKSTQGGGLTWGGMVQPPPPSLTNRPLFIDNNNNWYAGYHDVFKSTSQGSYAGSWTVAGDGGYKLSDFTNDFGVPANSTLSAIAVASSDANVIYAAYSNASWINAPTVTTNKIFRTVNGGTTWTDITPGLEAVRYAGITRIAIDPNNPYRIWITFNDIWESGTPGLGVNRVVYGHIVNSNWIWEDYSKNLPPFPVLSIVYQEGTNDALYVGTDVGVYYTNNAIYPTQGWVCFSNQLPVIIVPDLEINYCSGKVRAATHGRGIWESPLVPAPPKTLSSSTISTPVSFTSDIRIPNGVTVTLTSTMNMAAGKKIIVERGGNLTVNGGTITNACGLMWQGIEVQGNHNASQLTTGAQGKVILKNGALIENAREAIYTIKVDANGNLDWNYTGGIVQAQNTTFRNCRKAAAFLSYQNVNPVSGASLNNISYFKNCAFETTQQLNDPNANLDDHVSLYDVRGIKFLGCDFSNNAPNGANQGVIQNGIKSIDAAYIIADLCLSTLLPCNNVKQSSFKNLKYGIYATNSNPLFKVTVNHAMFENNRYDGVYLKGMNYPMITNCSFDVGGSNQLSSGLYLDNCKYYSVQNNQFFTTSTSGGNVGIWANNSKAGAHEIYNNTFTGLTAGIVPLNDNSGMSNTTDGLRMNCNTFSGNAYDIGITGGGNNNSIALVQGSTPGTAKDLVRNRYSALCGNENQFYITGSTKQLIHATNSDANTQPLPQPSCSDVLVQVQPTNIAFLASDCPDKTLLTNQQRTALISQLTSDALALKNNYNALIDGGNTQQLLNTINSNIPAGSIKNTLINKSPYLSDTVMVSYLGKPAPTPPGHVKDIIISNSPVTNKIKTKVDAVNLPNGIRQQINAAQTGVSPRLKLEAQIAQTEFNSQLYTADIINSFLSDTLVANPIDSVINVLTIYPRPDASKELVLAYVAKGDYTNALALINSFPSNNFYELQKLIIQVNQATDKAYSLQTNAALKNSLEVYANDCTKEGCAYAQALLNLVFNTQYPELRMLPQNLRSMELENTISYLSGGQVGVLSIYPNPATDELNILFNDTLAPTAMVEIHDLLGKLIEQVSLKSGVTYSYNTATLPKSVYLVSLYIDGKIVENKKLVLIK